MLGMIGKQEFKNLRLYFAYLAVLLGLFIYADFRGWKIYNRDQVEHVPSGSSRTHGVTRFYHK